jgi:hypothetical protein
MVLIAGFLFVREWTCIDLAPVPSQKATNWAVQTLEAWSTGGPIPPVPEEASQYQSAGPVIVTAWWRGKARARFQADSFVKAIQGATRSFSADTVLVALKTKLVTADNPLHFSITVIRGYGPLIRSIPIVSSLGVVPMVEGIEAELNGKRAYLTPDDLIADGYHEGAVKTPLPDLSFGVDLDALVSHLAEDLNAKEEQLINGGRIRRFRALTITAASYPSADSIRPEDLERASRQGAQFLLRHQHRRGPYTYIYNGKSNAPVPKGGYNMARHAGATYFLAKVDRSTGMPEARAGALKALAWVKRYRLKQCGGADRLCVSHRGRANMGATALSALAAAELLQNGNIPWVRKMLTGFTAFIRSMQRPDGELMHDFDHHTNRPIDVQHLYYSGEAAFALLRAYEVLGDKRDLETVRKLMTHLTGAGWNFFGSRYYYGEEHWTCQAAGAATGSIDVGEAYDFCSRWAAFNSKIQFADTSPWPIDGGYGVGPLFAPRITPVASRTEALISIYEMAKRRGDDTRLLRDQVERGLRFMMRYRWAPGPAHLLFDPKAAFGGMPGSPVGLTVRNDYVQHAGTAMLLWAEIERQGVEQPLALVPKIARSR